MKNTWDQQINESSLAFERFAQYRDMGAGRSLRKLAKDLELNPSTLAEISAKHDWQERVRAFDSYIDKASQHNQIVQIKAMKRRQIAFALKAQKASEKCLRKLMRDVEDNKGSVRIEGIAKLLDIGCRLERLNRDEAERNIEINERMNYDNLSIEELEQFRQLLLKAEMA